MLIPRVPSPLRLSANLHFLWPELPFLDRFAAARRAGFAAVEFPDPYQRPLPELTARLAEHDLACVLFNFPMGDPARGEKGLACLPGREAEFCAGLPRVIEVARALGCPRANCMAGVVPAGVEPARAHATLVANLRHAARAFAAEGLTVCLEALNTTDVPGYAVSGSRQALAVIEEVGEANLRFQLDLYHMHVMERDLRATIDRCFAGGPALPAVAHVQIADWPGRHEPGTGEIPYPAIFAHLSAQLDRAGYQGYVGAEYHPSRRTEETFAWRRFTS